MPGFYAPGEYDLAGCIVGVVERERLVTGAAIQAGDIAIGLPSVGLHTNGYSLARRVFAEWDLRAVVPELGATLGAELLRPHPCYLDAVWPALEAGLVSGMAHITGGGLVENLPRVVPEALAVRLDASTWQLPPIFPLIQRVGAISWEEMQRVFNLGIGFVLFCHPAHAANVLEWAAGAGARQIGVVEARAADLPQVWVEGLG
jgi:phosphoribosylformylglycinamidine cyclo-ligase